MYLQIIKRKIGKLKIVPAGELFAKAGDGLARLCPLEDATGILEAAAGATGPIDMPPRAATGS